MAVTRLISNLAGASALTAACMLSGCAAQPAPSLGLALVYINTDEDFKDSRVQGSDDSRDDGWGLRVLLDPGQKDNVVVEAG